MTTLREAAQQALEALEEAGQYIDPGDNIYPMVCDAADALQAALEQPEQEPVAWMYVGIKHDGTTHGPHLVWKPEHMDAMSAEKGVVASPLFTHPPRREWRGLTEDELTAFGIIHSRYQEESLETGGWFDFARAIEAALKERNA